MMRNWLIFQLTKLYSFKSISMKFDKNKNLIISGIKTIETNRYIDSLIQRYRSEDRFDIQGVLFWDTYQVGFQKQSNYSDLEIKKLHQNYIDRLVIAILKCGNYETNKLNVEGALSELKSIGYNAFFSFTIHALGMPDHWCNDEIISITVP